MPEKEFTFSTVLKPGHEKELEALKKREWRFSESKTKGDINFYAFYKGELVGYAQLIHQPESNIFYIDEIVVRKDFDAAEKGEHSKKALTMLLRKQCNELAKKWGHTHIAYGIPAAKFEKGKNLYVVKRKGFVKRTRLL